MNVTIKDVKECRNKAYGNFITRKDHVLITISRKKNTTIAEYGATVLHELLHLWVTFLRLKGCRLTNVREHRFIYLVEEKVIAALRKHLRRKK